MAEILDLISLHYFGEGHDKVWVGAVVKRDDSSYSYMSCWGRRGAAMQKLIRPASSLNNANSEFNAKVYEKERKGYKKISWDSFGIRESVEALVKSFSTGANPIIFSSRPDILLINAIGFTAEKFQALLQDDQVGLIQSVAGTRKRVEIIPGKPALSQDAKGVATENPASINMLANVQHQLLLDGFEVDGRFAIVDIFELDGNPITWLPYTVRMSLLEKELVSAGQSIPVGYTIKLIPENGLGLLAATSNKSSKVDLVSNLPGLGRKSVYFRNIMSPFETNAKIQEFDLSPIV